MNAQSLFRGGVDGSCRSEERGEVRVVAQTVINGELAGDAPGILSKEADRDVVKGFVGSADALNEIRRNAKAIGLKSGCAGKADGCAGRQRDAIGKTKGARRKAAEVHDAAEIKFEDLLFGGTQLEKGEIRADLEGVAATGDGASIGELEAALDAIDGGVRLAAEIRVARNVYADVATTFGRGITEMEPAASELESEFVVSGVAENGVVFKVTLTSR